MGEYAEMMLDGTCCAGCGEFMDGSGDGFPRYCSEACKPDDLKRASRKAPDGEKPFFCKNEKSIAALRYWLRDRGAYNCVARGDLASGKPYVGLNMDWKPDSDWAKIEKRGLIICDSQELADQAEKMANAHIAGEDGSRKKRNARNRERKKRARARRRAQSETQAAGAPA
jgi:hypothetical protein